MATFARCLLAAGAKPIILFAARLVETLYRAESGGGADWSMVPGPEATIPGFYGRDELGRTYAGLLCHTLGQLNAQKQQLEQEIGERKGLRADLRATQDELIQTR